MDCIRYYEIRWSGSWKVLGAASSATGRRDMTQYPDCYCHTCDREIHHLGIATHRAAHRRKNEDCKITFSTGVTCTYDYSVGRQK